MRHSLDITDSLVTCLAHEPPSYLWTGHMDGCIRLWCLVDGRRVAAPMGLYACPVTAVAVDPEYVGTPATAAGGCGSGTASGTHVCSACVEGAWGSSERGNLLALVLVAVTHTLHGTWRR